MILDAKDVRFAYRRRTVLQQVALQVNEGELLAILGPNGAGKTTLMRCLNRLLNPSGGTVAINRSFLNEMTGDEIARAIGYVPQRSQANRLTVFDAVLLGRRPHIRWRVGKKDLQTVESALRHLALDQLALRPLDQLSGGELQKVSIARALVQEPRLLLLDEPTASLDLRNENDVLGFIDSAVRSHRVGAIIILHDLNTALRTADRFLFLKAGKVLACGGPEIVTAETIKQVYDTEVEIGYHRGWPYVFPLTRASSRTLSPTD